jgi:hypothetical protein
VTVRALDGPGARLCKQELQNCSRAGKTRSQGLFGREPLRHRNVFLGQAQADWVHLHEKKCFNPNQEAGQRAAGKMLKDITMMLHATYVMCGVAESQLHLITRRTSQVLASSLLFHKWICSGSVKSEIN